MDFVLLGDVVARHNGRPVCLGHARQRCVLAILLIHANQTVSVDQLVDRVWADHPPRQARNTLYGYLCRLRQALAVADDVAISRGHGGYQLTVDPAAVDAHRFGQLVVQARAARREQDRLALFDEALALWQGEAFAGLDTPWLATQRAALNTQRFAAELDRSDLALSLGYHDQLLTQLSARAAEHPLNERVARQLMLALYRSGRPAEALTHYESIRRRLAEELGVDPSAAMQQLHQQILVNDLALAAPSAPPPAGDEPAPLVPRQLPVPPRCFAARSDELAQLSKAINGSQDPAAGMAIIAIRGGGGIGKTWLALHWAHSNLGLFPDGQLYIDLHGFDPSQPPVPAEVAIRGFLEALDVNPASVPADLQAQAGLFRSMVAGKRLLVVLDNARDTAQILPLLPGSTSCTVLITSRHQLTSLATAHGARMLDLDVLTDTEARQLLEAHLGRNRMSAEPAAVTALLHWCGGLPLALGIVAARATARPDFALGVFAEELQDVATRLDALDAADLTTNLRAVLAASYRSLPPEAAKLFRLLGLAPGPDIALPAAAALGDLNPTQARPLLRSLENAHLIQEHQPGRYRMHDLLRLYAGELACRDDSEQTRHAALQRLVHFYLRTAYAGDRLLDPNRPQAHTDQPLPDGAMHPLRDAAAALAWFDAEHTCLLSAQRCAAQHGWHRQVWQLAWALSTFHWQRGHLHADLSVWQAGHTSAAQLGEPVLQALAHRLLGRSCARLGRHADALDHLDKALALFTHAGAVTDQAHTHQTLAWVWGQQGDDDRALAHATKALTLHRALGHTTWEADALNLAGWYNAKLGKHAQASALSEQALMLYRQHDNRNGEAATLDSLGYIAHISGVHATALRYFQEALVLFGELGNQAYAADTLAQLGEAHRALGHRAEAEAAWRQALDLYRAQQRTHDARRVEDLLSSLHASVIT